MSELTREDIERIERAADALRSAGAAIAAIGIEMGNAMSKLGMLHAAIWDGSTIGERAAADETADGGTQEAHGNADNR